VCANDRDLADVFVVQDEITFAVTRAIGPAVADIRKLYGDLGIFTYDPGYGATASCESKITYIDGDEGVLLYRGYPIEQLAEKSNFLEICYLLLNGDLPDAKQRSRRGLHRRVPPARLTRAGHPAAFDERTT